MKLDIVAGGVPLGALREEVEALAAGYEPAWYTTLNQDGSLPAWFLARHEGRLLGFLTVFDPAGDAAEVGAWVEPGSRRQGVFTALLAAARQRWASAQRRWLLVVERSDADGAAVARHWGTLAFTESTLVLPGSQRPAFAGLPGGLTVAEAGASDAHEAARVLAEANGEEPGAFADFLARVASDPERSLWVLRGPNGAVGVGGLHRNGGKVGLFALAVDPRHQGKGWGRALALALLHQGGPEAEFELEVDSTNGRAESLYRSLGFTDRSVTDYYGLQVT